MLNSLEVLIVTENSNVELQALVLVNLQRNTKTLHQNSTATVLLKKNTENYILQTQQLRTNHSLVAIMITLQLS